jgi:hypothetical protein
MKEEKDFSIYHVRHEGLFPASHRGVLGRAAKKVGNAEYQVFESEGQIYEDPVYINGVKQEMGVLKVVPPRMLYIQVYTTRKSDVRFLREYKAMAQAKEERMQARRRANRVPKPPKLVSRHHGFLTDIH